MNLLLDACTLIWLASAPHLLSPTSTRLIDSPENALWLSDCTVWEICLKWQVGKLKLPTPPRRWIQQQQLLWRLESLTIDRNHLFKVSELPMHHRDPYDRLLVAQAIDAGLTIVTPDVEIHKYPVHFAW